MRKQNMDNTIQNQQEPAGKPETPSIQHGLSDTIWEAIFDSIPDLVAVIDKNCRIVRVNKALADRIGKPEEEITGMHCYESIHGMFNPMEGCPHVDLLRDGEGHQAEVFEPLLNGVFLVSTTPIYDKQGNILGSVHVSRDITGRKQAEDKLQDYNRELEELNASKDKFFSVIAHDLKSPFQGLLGFSDLLLDDFDQLEREEIRKYVINIRNASNNTYSLLENLLEWSRMQSGRIKFNPVVFNLTEEIGNIMEMLASNALRKGIFLKNDLSRSIEVSGDQHMIRSVVQNLLSNAIKFSNPRGEIIVSSKILPLNHLHRGQRCSCDRSCVQISVADQGIGMHADALKRIFNLNDHYSMPGTANEPGTGLGLILSREMIERHGGEITVQSTPGEGSVFSFTLPMP